MAGIYDLFKFAAKGVESASLRGRVALGAMLGVGYQSLYGDQDLSFGERIGKGLFIGATAGAGAGMAIRGAGMVASAGEKLGRYAITSKMAQVQKQGWRALTKPGSLMVGGAVAGGMVAGAPGAAIGAGIGLAARPLKGVWSGYEALGKVPGAQTGAIIAASAVPLAAGVAFGTGAPEAEAQAMPGPMGIDYTPIDGGMKNRMIAMNASGDIVLGLHGRQHG